MSPSTGLGAFAYNWKTNYGRTRNASGDTIFIDWNPAQPIDIVKVLVTDTAGCMDTASLKIDLGLTGVFLVKNNSNAPIDTCNGFTLKQTYNALYTASSSTPPVTLTWTITGASGTPTYKGVGTASPSATIIWNPKAAVHKIKISATYNGCTRTDSLIIPVASTVCCSGIKCGGYPITNWQSSFTLSNLIASVNAAKPSSLTYDSCKHYVLTTYDSARAGTTYNFSPLSSTHLLPVIKHDTFFFHGVVQFNRSVVFDSCVFNMGYDAKIIVTNSGGLVRFKNGCVFHACGAYMWDGIYDSMTSNPDGLSLIGHNGSTIIQDAQNGIVIKAANTNFETFGCTYTNNFYSIQFPFTAYTSISQRTGIYNNTFTSTGITLAHDLVSTTSNVPLAHIYVNKAFSALLGVLNKPANTFEGGDIGIRTVSSYSFIYNNHFANFYYNSLKPYANGIGVYATQDDSLPRGYATGLELGGPGRVSSRNLFTNSDYGVIAGMVKVSTSGTYKFSGDIRIYYNTFTNVSCAITAATAREYIPGYFYSKKLFIVQDTIIDCDEGIQVGNFKATPAYAAPSYVAPDNVYLSISNNYIHAGGYAVSNTLSKFGIMYSFPSQPVILGDTIQTNQVYVKDGVTAGIKLSYAKGTLLRNNYLFLDKQVTKTTSMEGIHIESSANLKITCNTVKSLYDSSTSYINKKGAIMLYSVTNSTLENNFTHNTEVGFGFSGTNTGTYMWANDIKFHNTGVMRGDWQLKAVGSMSDQIYNHYPTGSSSIVNPGNQFFGRSNTGNYNSGCTTCGALFGFGSGSTALVHFYTKSGSFYPTNNIVSSSRLVSTPDASHSAYTSSLTCSVDTSQVHVYPIANAGGVINNTNTQYNSYPLINWLEKRDLYAAIKIDTTLLADTMIDHFYDTATTGNIGKFWSVNNYISLSSDTTLDTATRHADIEYAISANNSINPHCIYESNQKTVNNINLTEVIPNITLSNTDKTFIRNLTMQCVYISGTSVYQARNKRLLFDAPIAYDDGFICNGSGKKDDDAQLILIDRDDDASQTLFETDEYLKVYPNPANNNITFGYYLNTRATLKVVDLTGNLVVNVELMSGHQNNSLDISRWGSGVYIFYLVNEKGRTFRGKFVVAK